MNILILPTSYPNIYNENAAIFVQDQVRALSNYTNYNISVVGAIPISLKDIIKRRIFKFGVYKYKKENIQVKLFLYPSIPKLNSLRQFFRFYFSKKMITSHLKENEIDLCHVHNSEAAGTALWFKDKYNIPYIITEHSSAFYEQQYSLSEIERFKQYYLNASFNISVSEEFVKLLTNIFQKKFIYIPNLVDTDYFIPKKKVNSKKYTFLNVASLNKNKNHILLIESFEKLLEVYNDIFLIIVGAGEEMRSLKSLIKIKNLSNNISLFGYGTRSDVLHLMQTSDAFVLSSDYETFGVVLIEAMSCTLPIVSTKCAGPESILVDNRLGYLSESSVNCFTNAMKRLYKEEFNSDFIRGYAIDNFSQKVITKKLSKIYKQVVE